MALINVFKNLSKKTKIIMAVAAVAVIAGAVTLVVLGRSGYTATTMRLLRVEGTVNIEDSKGGTKPVIDKIRFQSGDALNTGNDGLASVGLDDTKIVTLQTDSRVEFQKQNKKLELKLTKGALFFEVMEHLKDDETYEIHTSNMTVGIRGTSGYVYYDESDKRESLVVTDGVVEVSATNPVTGETKTARVEGGKQIKVYLYSDRTEDTVEFELSDVSEESLPEFPLQRLAENEELLDRVCEFTGWDKEKLLDVINDAIEEENKEDEEITPTATPTEEATPTPEPVGGTPEGPSAPTITPPISITPTAKPTGAPTGSVTSAPSARPTTTAAPTPSSAPTTTPTAMPTSSATPTATPTATATATATATPTATPTVKATPTPKPGCEITDYAWDVEYEGTTIFVCQNVSGDDYLYYGYIDGNWVELEQQAFAGNGWCYVYFKDKATGENYYDGYMYKYEVVMPTVPPENTPTSTPTPAAPNFNCVPSDSDILEGHEKAGNWGTMCDGHPVYIIFIKEPTENNGYSYTDYRAYVNYEWVKLYGASAGDILAGNTPYNFYIMNGEEKVVYFHN